MMTGAMNRGSPPGPATHLRTIMLRAGTEIGHRAAMPASLRHAIGRDALSRVIFYRDTSLEADHGRAAAPGDHRTQMDHARSPVRSRPLARSGLRTLGRS